MSEPKRIAILQPGYLPWLGYFEQMEAVDLFVSLDDVAYTKQDWRNRNRIRTNSPEGWSWLTVPVDASTTTADGPIHRVRVRPYREWWPKHLRLLDQHYGHGKAPHYDRVRATLVERAAPEPELLADLDLALAAGLADLLGITTPVARSSELALAPDTFEPGDKTGRLLAICLAVGAGHLYDGASARDFLEIPRLEAAGVTASFQDYRHPEHSQAYGGFIPHLSAVDYLSWVAEL